MARNAVAGAGALCSLWAGIAVAGWAGYGGWLVEMPANFPLVPVLAAGLGLALLAWSRGRFGTMAGAAALAVVVAGTFAPRPGLKIGAGGGGALKFATWNACLGKLDPDAIVAWIDANEPDVIAFTEITQQLHGVLKKALKARYPYLLGTPRSGPGGLALFSKVPIANWRRVPGDARFGTCELLWPGGGVCRIVVAHPTAPTTAERTSERNATLRELGMLCGSERGPVVVLGDFNATWAVKDFRAFCREGGLVTASGYLPSWNAEFPAFLRIAIDHVLVREGDFTVTARSVGDEAPGSDHLPVLARIALRSRGTSASR